MSPNASSTQITEAIVEYIEATLTKVVKEIRLERAESSLTIISHDYITDRLPAGSRERARDKRQEKDRIIRELANLKFQLDGTDAPEMLLPTELTGQDTALEHIPNMISVYTSLSHPILPSDSPPKSSENHPKRQVNRFSPYSQTPFLATPDQAFQLGRAMQWRLSVNPHLIELVEKIELASRIFASHYNLDWKFELNEKTDAESPQWKKTVLFVHPGTEDFEQSLILWDELDTKIRTSLSSHEEETNQFNKAFFIEMDLK